LGTSQSSLGPPGGVPLVPPWVRDPFPPPATDAEAENGPFNDGQLPQQNQPEPPQVLAPPRRFGSARRSLARYGRTGSGDDMRRGIGHYVKRGLGGSAAAARRFGGSTRTAGALYGVLSSLANRDTSVTEGSLDLALIAGRSADEVMDAVVEAVRPPDGTQDAEASRNAVRTALSDLLERFPDADLINLADDQRLFVVERFLALDVYNRFRLDVGKTVQDNAPSVAAALSRMRQIREYIRETIAARFRALRVPREALLPRRVSRIAAQALREAFHVFEDYLR